MEFSEPIYERANLPYILECLQDENDKRVSIGKPYEERLKRYRTPLTEELTRILSRAQYLDIECLLNSALVTFQDVYFEVGIKVGAMLQRDLLTKD